jgi:hypothetical protein
MANKYAKACRLKRKLDRLFGETGLKTIESDLLMYSISLQKPIYKTTGDKVNVSYEPRAAFDDIINSLSKDEGIEFKKVPYIESGKINPRTLEEIKENYDVLDVDELLKKGELIPFPDSLKELRSIGELLRHKPVATSAEYADEKEMIKRYIQFEFGRNEVSDELVNTIYCRMNFSMSSKKKFFKN